MFILTVKGFEDDGPIKLPEIPEETMDEVTSENKEEKLDRRLRSLPV